MSNRERIRDFIRQHSGSEVRDHEDIFAQGLVSSMFVMQLVLFVEQQFGISVAGEDLNFDFFRSVDTVNALVDRKLAA